MHTFNSYISGQNKKTLMRAYLSLIKFSHTVFAMPFALLGFFLGIFLTDFQGGFTGLLFKVIACMVFARSAAMAFNRYLDKDIDRKNPRTSSREIPAGIILPENALIFVLLNAILFIGTTFWINKLCFYLSPVALLVILGYSYTKRFTSWCHLILGVGLGLAPIGAFLAVTGFFHPLPVIYSVAVLCWVAGFDIIYSLQDVEFDRAEKLRSVPVRWGVSGALTISRMLHFFCAILLITANFLALKLVSTSGWLTWIALVIFLILLVRQQALVRGGHLEKVNLAFFTLNGLASLIYCSLFIVDLYL